MDVRSPCRRTGGFSLLELVVVIGLLILAAGLVASSNFAARRSADDLAAQATLGAALDAQQGLFDTDGQLASTQAQLRAVNPRLTASASASTGPQLLSVTLAPDGASVGMAALADSGTCWLVRYQPRDLSARDQQAGWTFARVADGATWPCSGSTAAQLPTAATASGSTGSSWADPLVWR